MSREHIIQQVVEQEESVRDFRNYIPIGKASQKLNEWVRRGAVISYLSALTENKKGKEGNVIGKEGLNADDIVLNRYGFPRGFIYHREQNETYADVVSRIMPSPEIFIEDDCESIGKEKMTYPRLESELMGKIKSIIVPEFGGIDHLPDNPKSLV